MNISPMRIKVDLQHWCLIANQALFHQFKNYPTSISLTAEVYKTKVKLSLSPIQNLQVKEEKTPAYSFKFKHLTWETEDLCIFCLIHVNLTCQNCRVFFRGTRAWGTSCTLRTSVECLTGRPLNNLVKIKATTKSKMMKVFLHTCICNYTVKYY